MSAGMLGTEDPPAIRACEALIAEAIERGASDIHLEPRHQGGHARLRIDGLLHDGTEFEPILFDRIVTRINGYAPFACIWTSKARTRSSSFAASNVLQSAS